MRHSGRALSCALVMIVSLLGPVAVTSPAAALGDGKKAEVSKIAKSLKGTPYSYGGTSPSSGFDCSGFTQHVFKKAGAGNLDRTAGAQAKQGRAIKKDDKRRGDLVYFHDGGGVYHIGIYQGDQKIWHAPSTGKSVELARIWTGDYKVRRIGA
ncbi:C40 family peptidase [Aeromicrobium sp. CF4.19]|uniref:C40 family peptidase n=1 Tax=Aeromicrobium sp. CF4.19 TaxID=3373082 RepID=UPI003EE67407